MSTAFSSPNREEVKLELPHGQYNVHTYDEHVDDVSRHIALIYTCIAMHFFTKIHYNWVMATIMRDSKSL